MARHGSTASRARRAARRADSGPVSTTALMRHGDFAPSKGKIKRSKGRGLGGSQRNSEGARSEWSASPTYWTDSKWSATVGDL